MQNMGQLCNVIHGLKPGIVMIVVQIGYAALNILYKVVAEDGVNVRILIAYRMMFASAFMIPLALVFGRWTAFTSVFFLSFFQLT
jgi:hypothetical protein